MLGMTNIQKSTLSCLFVYIIYVYILFIDKEELEDPDSGIPFLTVLNWSMVMLLSKNTNYGKLLPCGVHCAIYVFVIMEFRPKCLIFSAFYVSLFKLIQVYRAIL